ncbi:hypothetical protein [Butyrivibrio sp. VCD2006]|uniref:hypothetical protein n=1 Tax=Butyrivibrio sp. VCD2006 TaxID=1280664 RepID=UPI0018C9B0A8|nr:hypothetical protein [Butyrivibrio sp. VCD2006]
MVVKSNIEFPQLLAIEESTSVDNDCDLTIELRDSNSLSEEYADIIKKGGKDKITDNSVWFRNQVGDFLIETVDNRSRMLCEKFEDVPDSVIRSFFLGNCIAVAMTQRNKIVLHGSSILIGDSTVLVCGNSGSGKSTTSMALIDSGARLMADDISVIDIEFEDGMAYAYPAFPEQKVCRDAAVNRGLDLNELTYIDEDRDKFSYLRSDIFVCEKRKVDTLIIINSILQGAADDEFENGIRIKEISGADKVNAITDMFFLKWLYGKGFELRPNEMLKCFSLANQIRVFEVTRENGLDTRKEIIDRIFERIIY